MTFTEAVEAEMATQSRLLERFDLSEPNRSYLLGLHEGLELALELFSDNPVAEGKPTNRR